MTNQGNTLYYRHTLNQRNNDIRSIPSSRPKRLKNTSALLDLEREACSYTHKLQLQPVRKIILKRPEFIEPGYIVLVKWQAPYPHWPALIKKRVDNHIGVMFFGDNRYIFEQLHHFRLISIL